jgi:hypothetical protein
MLCVGKHFALTRAKAKANRDRHLANSGEGPRPVCAACSLSDADPKDRQLEAHVESDERTSEGEILHK